MFELKIQKTEVGEVHHVWQWGNKKEKSNCNRILNVQFLNILEDGGPNRIFIYEQISSVVYGTSTFGELQSSTEVPRSGCKYLINSWLEY